MNEEEDEFHQKEMEERLYASIHHGSNLPNQEMEPNVDTADQPGNSNRMRSNLKRYFQHMKINQSNNRSFKPRKNNQGNNVDEQIPENSQAPKRFVPYVPLLSQFSEDMENPNSPTKKKKYKKFINPTNPMNQRKIAMLHKIQEKKIKAERSRAKKVMGVIDLISSEDEDCENEEEDPKAEEEKEVLDDDVIMIPVPPPPLVVIQSSDDEDKDKFASPKSSNSSDRKRNARCGSPSGSSLMSDDFIGQADKRRLQQDKMNMSIVCDENTMNATVEDILHPAINSTNESIDESANFIRPHQASDVTTKHSSELETHSECSNSSDFPRGLRVMKATPKTVRPAEKRQEDDSIYSVKGNLDEQISKSKKMSKRRKSVGNKSTDNQSSSSDSENNDVNSKSAYNSDASSKSKKKTRRKRKKFDSEHYSDEDFRNILTNIVNAESSAADSEESDSNNLEIIEKSNSDVEEVAMVENTISLPQITINEDLDNSIEVCPQEPDEVQSVSDASEDQVREKWNQEINYDDPEVTWNYEMKKFYNESWNCEDFNVSTVVFNMPRSPKHWSIINKDKYPDPPKGGPVCHNCNIYGHTKFKCPQKKKPLMCPMCGFEGHTEPRCPNTICLKCGSKTSTFLKECKNCAYEKNIVCHGCQVKGHAIKNCPDKWRRFHNTIKDNEQLNTHLVYNPNSRQCSICTKKGHEAHKCNNALQIFGYSPQSTQIRSHAPVYHPMNWLEQPSNKYSFNTFSDLVNFDLNYDKSITTPENGFYDRFARATGLDKFKKKEKQIKRKLFRKSRDTKSKQTQKVNEPQIVEEPSVIEENDKEIVTEELSQKSTTDEAASSQVEATSSQVESGSSQVNPLDESLMTIDSVNSIDNNSIKNLDFIPLSSDNLSSQNAKTDAKIYLSKIHSKILLGSKGADFLKDSSKKYDLKLSISFEKIGNVLVVFGISENQDNFHAELVNYLNENEKQLNEMKIINQVPKIPVKVLSFIRNHLEMLKKNYGKVQDIYKRLVHFEGGNNVKSCEKVRRNLNIVLFGQLRLKEGGLHLDSLNENIKTLENSNDQTIPTAFREEIFQHIKYIFTAYNHNNYQEVVDDYVNNQSRVNQMTLPSIKNDLILNVAEPMNRNQASFNLFFSSEGNNSGSNRQTFENRQNYNNNNNNNNRSNFDNNRQNFDNNRQNFDNNRQNFNNNRQSLENNRNNYNKIGNWRTRLPKMLQECKYLVTQINNRALADKFNRTFCYMERSGYPTFQNFKQLDSILITLKGHIYQNNKGN